MAVLRSPDDFVRNAAALFLMTAVFRRTMWKYHLARAYRVVLLDAGHLCQTFCLSRDLAWPRAVFAQPRSKGTR